MKKLLLLLIPLIFISLIVSCQKDVPTQDITKLEKQIEELNKKIEELIGENSENEECVKELQEELDKLKRQLEELETEQKTPAEQPTTPPEETTTPVTDPTTPQTNPETPSTDPTTPSTDPETPPTDPTTPSTNPETPPEEPIVSSDVVYTINISDIPSTNGKYMNSNFYFCENALLCITQGMVTNSGDITFRKGSSFFIGNLPPSSNPRKITMTVGIYNNDNSVWIKPYTVSGGYTTPLDQIFVSALESPYVLENVFPAYTENYYFEIDNNDNKSRLKVYDRINIQDYVQ